MHDICRSSSGPPRAIVALVDKNRQLATTGISVIVAMLVALAPRVGVAGTADGAPARPVDCKALEREIRRIHSRMRAGYSAREGIRLEARLRELRKKRAKYCRR